MERQEERRSKAKSRNMDSYNGLFFSLWVLKPYLMTGTKIVVPSDSQDNNIFKRGRQRDKWEWGFHASLKVLKRFILDCIICRLIDI